MPRKYTDEYVNNILVPVVQSSWSFAQVLKKIGLKQTGGNHANIKNVIVSFGVDYSHFKGQAWCRGLTKETDSSVNKSATSRSSLTAGTVFKKNSLHRGARLRKFLLISGVKHVCKICNLLPAWNGSPLVLHVDHINGDRMDNRKKNLRFLCPNCHQQTETWGSKKIRKK